MINQPTGLKPARPAALAALAAIALAACGGGIETYADGVAAQTEVMQELIEILEGVDDQASADAAVDDIEALGDKLAGIATQMQALPEPTMDELVDIGQQQSESMLDFQQRAMPQLMKLAQYPNLSSAWLRAMENIS